MQRIQRAASVCTLPLSFSGVLGSHSSPPPLHSIVNMGCQWQRRRTAGKTSSRNVVLEKLEEAGATLDFFRRRRRARWGCGKEEKTVKYRYIWSWGDEEKAVLSSRCQMWALLSVHQVDATFQSRVVWSPFDVYLGFNYFEVSSLVSTQHIWAAASSEALLSPRKLRGGGVCECGDCVSNIGNSHSKHFLVGGVQSSLWRSPEDSQTCSGL